MLDADNNEDNTLSLDEIPALVQQTHEDDQDLAEQLAPFLQGLVSNPGIPAKGQTLAAVLLQLLAGTTIPDLNGLPAELAKMVRRPFDLSEA